MSIQKPKEQLVQISEAAKILGVSIDTVRRWEQAGKLHSQRLDGKNRHFNTEDLKRFSTTAPLSISDTAKKLGISITTLRRYDKEGKLKAERNATGERVYPQGTVAKFLKSKKRGITSPKAVASITSPVPTLTPKPYPLNPAPDILSHSSFTLGLPSEASRDQAPRKSK